MCRLYGLNLSLHHDTRLGNVAEMYQKSIHQQIGTWAWMIFLLATLPATADELTGKQPRSIMVAIFSRVFPPPVTRLPRTGCVATERGTAARSARRSNQKVIFPGDWAGSPLLARIISGDPDEQMPPPSTHKDPLTGDQIDLLRRWIDQSGPWQRHWSFRPIKGATRRLDGKLDRSVYSPTVGNGRH